MLEAYLDGRMTLDAAVEAVLGRPVVTEPVDPDAFERARARAAAELLGVSPETIEAVDAQRIAARSTGGGTPRTRWQWFELYAAAHRLREL